MSDGHSPIASVEFSDGSQNCELYFEGEVTACVEPSAGVGVSADNAQVLHLDGEGTYRLADGTRTFSTMFLMLTVTPSPAPSPAPSVELCDDPIDALGDHDVWIISSDSPFLERPDNPGTFVAQLFKASGRGSVGNSFDTGGTGEIDDCLAAPPAGSIAFDGEALVVDLSSDDSVDLFVEKLPVVGNQEESLVVGP